MLNHKFIEAFIDLTLDAAPWLLFGLVVAGLVKGWLPEERLKNWLGGRGFKPIFIAAFIGAPLPLCSCGVIPAAVALRRGGASREATISFLISTPETGVDSIAISYGFFGPFLTIARPIAALFTAITTAYITTLIPEQPIKETKPPGCCPADSSAQPKAGLWRRAWDGIAYALTDMLQDIFPWILFGLVFTAALTAFVPSDAFTQWGDGILGMVVMVILGIPMYICATSATPIAAGLLVAGVSPGAALVFLLAGPATNIATLGAVKNELGSKVAMVYLAGIIICSIIAGLVVNALVEALAIDIRAQAANVGDIVPLPLAALSALILVVLGVAPLFKRLISSRYS